ncbi:hypothetical protein [Amycolatopsis magusensis]|uniref:hypothetical protein n=1 Tax=Amycolatopsis magusensis TaxID=882444 RepID=UPI003C2FB304
MPRTSHTRQDIYYARREAAHKRRTLQLALITTAFGTISALVALIAYLLPRTPEERKEHGQLSVVNGEHGSYYPKDGVLPAHAPPAYPRSEAIAHCDEWESWARDVGAASTVPSLMVSTVAGRTSPITILNVKAQIFSRKPINGNTRIQCQYGAGGAGGTTLHLDLEAPGAPKDLDIDSDGEVEAKLPGGRFTVDPEVAEWLNIQLDGLEGSVYQYSLEFDVAENGSTRKETVGSPQRPLTTAFDDYAGEPKNFDWDFSTAAWTAARHPGYDF